VADRLPKVAKGVSFLPRVQTVLGAHLISYSGDTGGSLPGGKTVGASSWPPISY